MGAILTCIFANINSIFWMLFILKLKGLCSTVKVGQIIQATVENVFKWFLKITFYSINRFYTVTIENIKNAKKSINKTLKSLIIPPPRKKNNQYFCLTPFLYIWTQEYFSNVLGPRALIRFAPFLNDQGLVTGSSCSCQRSRLTGWIHCWEDLDSLIQIHFRWTCPSNFWKSPGISGLNHTP